jgi:hypothetical protein
MDLARFETPNEFNFLSKITLSMSKNFQMHTIVDGMTLNTKSPTKWFYSNGKNFTTPIKWHAKQPDNYYGNDRCMDLWKDNSEFSYDDIPCIGSGFEFKVLCQKEIQCGTLCM